MSQQIEQKPEPAKGQIWEHCREPLLLEVTALSMIPGMTHVKIIGENNVIFQDRIWTDKLHREWNLRLP